MRFRRSIGIGALVLLASCGDFAKDPKAIPPSPAVLSVSITDAASDDIASFTVDIAAMQLTHLSGAVVGVMSAPVTVDLVSLTDLSQILNVMTVPPGLYTGGTITLDFTNARCVLNGQTTPASISDHNGNAVTGLLTLPLSFGGGSFNAIAGKHRILELDFDLDQSVASDMAGNAVRLESSFVMRVDPAQPKDLITIGTLDSVDAGASTFTADVKRLGGATIATVTFASSGATIFQVDGVPSTGAAGLSALAGLGAGAWIQTYGAINPVAKRIDVVYVEAGHGTYNGGDDIVEGHIVGRSGGAGSDATLTVLGHSNNSTHTIFQFNTSFTVNTTFANTKVVRRGVASAYDTDDLNVGQLVRVFGALTGTTMDATAGVVRQQPTRVFGIANGPPSGTTVTINLSRVDLRPQSAFTWGQGGTTPPVPASFTLGVGLQWLGLGIVNGSAIECRGFFPAVDDSGSDFNSLSLINRDNSPSLLFIRDLPGGQTVATTASASQIQFAISGAPGLFETAVIDKGFSGATPLPASPTPTVTGHGGITVYMIRDASTGALTFFLVFSDFSNALGAALGGGKTLYHFGAVGTYTVGTNTLAAQLAVAVIY